LIFIGTVEKSTDSSNCDSASQTIGIAVLSVLLTVAVICIVGLVIWIVKLKLAQVNSKEV